MVSERVRRRRLQWGWFVFFQAEDGIRDIGVTGVQTCALPIYRTYHFGADVFGALVAYPATDGGVYDYRAFVETVRAGGAVIVVVADLLSLALLTPQIGRASCRERV